MLVARTENRRELRRKPSAINGFPDFNFRLTHYPFSCKWATGVCIFAVWGVALLRPSRQNHPTSSLTRVFSYGPIACACGLCFVRCRCCGMRVGLAAEADKPAAPAGKVSYFRDVRPIFQVHCQGCHQPAKAMGEFVMTDFDGAAQGGRERASRRSCRASRTRATCSTQITPADGKAEMPKDKPPLAEDRDQADPPMDRRRGRRRHAGCRSRA